MWQHQEMFNNGNIISTLHYGGHEIILLKVLKLDYCDSLFHIYKDLNTEQLHKALMFFTYKLQWQKVGYNTIIHIFVYVMYVCKCFCMRKTKSSQLRQDDKSIQGPFEEFHQQMLWKTKIQLDYHIPLCKHKKQNNYVTIQSDFLLLCCII